MRITFVLPTVDMGGGCRVLAIYAQRLARKGHQIHVVVPPRRKPSLRARFEACLRGESPFAFPRVLPSHFDLCEVPIHVLRENRPVADQDVPDADVIVSTFWTCAEWIRDFPPGKGAKVLFAQGFEIGGNMPDDRIRGAWMLPMHKIVISRWLADIAANEFGDNDISIIPNGVDLDQFYVEERGKQSRLTVGYVYSTTRCKRCDLIFAAIERARVFIPELRIISFGTALPIPEVPFPADAEYARLPEQASLRGFYGSCDVWLHASEAEGFGLPILEAMACRTPVIATPAGAAPELLADGGGLLIEHNNPEAMAAAILRIAELPDKEWREISRLARSTAERYTWYDAVEKFEAALQRAVQRSREANNVEI